MPGWSRRAWVWAVVGPIALAMVAWGSIHVAIRERLDPAEFAERYDELSKAARDRDFLRPANPPGWDLIPGRAAELYRAAWRSCDVAEMDETSVESLQRAVRAMSPHRGAEEDGVNPQGDATVPASECVAVGVPPDTEDRLAASLEPHLCVRLRACAHALEKVFDGTQRADARSPLHVWDEWAAESSGDLRSAAPFFRLAWLTLLRGYVDGLTGGPGDELEGIFTVLRFSRDLSNGSGIVGAIIGVSIERNGADRLEALLSNDRLSLEEAEETLEALRYLRQSPRSIRTALEEEFVTTASIGLDEVPGLFVPPTAIRSTGEMGDWERVVFLDFLLNDYSTMWEDVFAMQDEPYPRRVERYRELQRDMARSLNPLSRIGAVDYAKYDGRVTAAAARVALLEIVTADLAFRRRTGQPVAGLETLGRWFPGLPQRDPVADEPFLLEVTPQGRLVRSAATEPGRAEALVLAGEDVERLRVSLSSRGASGP